MKLSVHFAELPAVTSLIAAPSTAPFSAAADEPTARSASISEVAV
jgi:hypothetical protein